MTGVSRALDAALKSCVSKPEDAAAIALAKTYAETIDADPVLLWRVGPRLLEVLCELGMTPKARATVTGSKSEGTTDDRVERNPLDELRKRRTAREHDSA